MSDAERSIQACLAAFAEYQRMLKHSLRHRHDAKVRIAVQVAKGRVLNTQLSNTVDFKPEAEKDGEIVEIDVELAMLPANEWFGVYHVDLTSAIADRRDGWLRLMIAVSSGAVQSGNLNPSFDLKTT